MTAKKTIYIIRHGETDYNKRRIIQGQGIDSVLNDTGHKQAFQFYRAYHHIPFDVIYTSSLRRTQQSVQDFIEAGFKQKIMPEFDEISWGIFEGLLGDFESKSKLRSMINDWSAGLLDRSVDDGETPNSVFKRQKEGIRKILMKPDKNILICTHGRALKILLCLMTKTPLEEMEQFRHSNLTLYQFDYDGKDFKIIKSNCTKHLMI